MALDDADANNGAMAMLPGSHKIIMSQADPYQQVHIGKNHGEYFQKSESGQALSKISPAICEMKAGSVSFHNGLTLHAAGPNNSPARRRAMTCALMPVDATFNGISNVYTDGQMERYTLGDPLSDDELNPLLYHEASPSPSFPEGLPNLQFSGHHDDPIDVRQLSSRQKEAAVRLGYI